MNIRIPYVASVLAGVFLMVAGSAISETVKSLRGPNAVSDTVKAPRIYKPQTESRIPRTFRTQPPLVPHAVTKHRIDLRSNRCLGCHDRAVNTEHQAPAISRSHYIRRNGTEGISISKTRYFCTQCHVPQLNAKSLVGNTFRGVK